ncbi:MAG: sensor histidine kinase [Dermatophilaceae bacterium]|nr:HAMP domain-containing protein [Intrasporangiaceae bacterium]
MNRLVVRLVLSHLLVAVVGAIATFAIVRNLAPQLFDRELRRGPGGPGPGRLDLQDQFVAAVDSALAWGVAVGVGAAAVIGALAAYRLTRPLDALGDATRQLATGHYDVDVPRPGTKELDDLAEDVRSLGLSLAETESRRIRLLGEVAHEMRTPLTVVDGYVEGMIDGVLPADDATLSLLSSEMRRLRRLANDLSSLSRAEEGRLAISIRAADLRDIVRQAVERLRPQAEDGDVELTLGIPDHAVPAAVDPDRIAQVVTNVVGNALRATGPHGAVTISLATRGDSAVLSVSDTGEGLDPADLERVFERFYRVPGRRRTEAGSGDEGSGIGLTISRRITEAHGGSLEAASAGRGRGSTFTMTLPVHRPRPGPSSTG